MMQFMRSIVAGINPDDIVEFNLDADALHDQMDGNLATLEQLKPYRNLEKLTVTGHDLVSLQGIEHLPLLKSLDISHNNLLNLEGLQHLGRLVSLDVSYNEVAEIRPLAGLNALEYLNLGYNLIADLQCLRSMISLRALNLSGNTEVTDVAPIVELSQLGILSIKRLRLPDLSPLGHLGVLRKLILTVEDARELAPLRVLDKLTEVQIRFSATESLDGFPALAHLEDLSVAHCPNLRRADALVALQGLKRLSLAHNALEDAAFLKDMPYLEQLDLTGNPVCKHLDHKWVAHIPQVRW